MSSNTAPRQAQRQPERVDYVKVSHEVLSGLEANRPILEPLLPAGTPWARLHATIATLLTQNPGILRCTVASIIRACMKAVYDGLALDGREAALVPSLNTYGKPPNETKRLEARYNPMVAGFRKQILQGGLVDDVVTTCVFEGEPYRVIRGSNPSIEHEEILSKRGPGKKIVAVYSMAFLKSGRTTFETMTAAQVEEVRKLAQTKGVWDKNEHEMYRKTVLRRHRKSLPGGSEIRDAEMEILFPHMNQANASHTMVDAPPRPTRGDFAPPPPATPALEDQSENIFTDFDSRVEEVFDDRGGGEAGAKQPAKKKAAAKDPAADGEDSRNLDDPTGEVGKGPAPATKAAAYKPKIMVPAVPPPDERGWRYYADQVKAALPKLTHVDEINAERRAHQGMIDQAPGAIGDELDAAFTEALTELVAGG